MWNVDALKLAPISFLISQTYIWCATIKCVRVPTSLHMCISLCVCDKAELWCLNQSSKVSFISSGTLQVCDSPPSPVSPLTLSPPPHPTPWLSLHQQGRYCREGKTIALRDRFSYVVTQTLLSYSRPHHPTSTPPLPGSLHLREATYIHPFIFFFFGDLLWENKRKREARKVSRLNAEGYRGWKGQSQSQRERSARIEVFLPQKGYERILLHVEICNKGPTVKHRNARRWDHTLLYGSI